MFQALIQRSLSISLALVVTLAMLAGIDRLAAPQDAAPLLAQQSTARG